MSTLDTIELDPQSGAPKFSVIWLHGLGADGNDFVPIVDELQLPPAAAVRFVFPNAPTRPVTINMGMVMPAWYDIFGLDLGSGEDELGIQDSSAALERLIAAEVARGIPASRIVLAGFSQGGAIATHTALRHAEPLAGLMALSTYLPLQDTVASEANSANRSIPILQCHGAHDPMIPLDFAKASRDRLRKLGYVVDWRQYPMEHAVCAEQIRDIREWLLARCV